MITWWITEAVPIPVTALIPMIAFPLAGVMSPEEAAAPYAHPTIYLFLGGFLIALALEKHRLHERIALVLLRYTGTSGNGIILGFMLSTGFISMWISNTATAMMMMPMALSVVHLIQNLQPGQETTDQRNFALGLMLSVGYAATLGGLATVIGTPPNVIFKGLLDKFYHQEIPFGTWMLIGVPISILTMAATYFIVTRILFPTKIKEVPGSAAMFARNLQALGPISIVEKRVLAIFFFTSALWILQQPINTYLFQAKLLSDSNIAMAGGLFMFLIPATGMKKIFILDWKDTEKLQWGILILFGGGMCMAEGLHKTRIIQVVGDLIAQNNTYSITLLFILITITVVLSELMSNVALVQIFVPVVFGISDSLGIDPVLLGLPVTFAASIGFMLPIATPPNAIVFSSGFIKVRDMARAGFLLNLACILIIGLASVTLMRWFL